MLKQDQVIYSDSLHSLDTVSTVVTCSNMYTCVHLFTYTMILLYMRTRDLTKQVSVNNSLDVHRLQHEVGQV